MSEKAVRAVLVSVEGDGVVGLVGGSSMIHGPNKVERLWGITDFSDFG